MILDLLEDWTVRGMIVCVALVTYNIWITFAGQLKATQAAPPFSPQINKMDKQEHSESADLPSQGSSLTHID